MNPDPRKLAAQSKRRNRTLTDADARAIATELKKQLLADFHLEVGKGVVYWIKRAVVVLLLLLALYGALGDRPFLHQLIANGGNTK